VLVVEDEQPVRSLVMEVLQEYGFRAVSATDGVSGLEILQSDTHLDLLITDVGLPGLAGPHMVEQARKRRPELPVLFITGYASAHDFQAAMGDGNAALLAKPFTIDSLVSQIRARLIRKAPDSHQQGGVGS
jgi:DNA-binding response OmpR family regulator